MHSQILFFIVFHGKHKSLINKALPLLAKQFIIEYFRKAKFYVTIAERIIEV